MTIPRTPAARLVAVPLVLACLSSAAPDSRCSPSGRPAAALPHPQTLHRRLLKAQVVIVARCTKVVPKDDKKGSAFGGNSFKLSIKKVLLDRWPQDPLANYPMLSDLIPGSSVMGDTHKVPTDVDALIFAQRDLDKHLSLLSVCTNSVVSTEGMLEELPGPKYETKKIKADEFLKLVEKRIKDFASFDWLRKQYDGAMGSKHPFSAHDKSTLLALLLGLPDKRVAGLAKSLNEGGVTDQCQEVLDRYFSKHKQFGELREAMSDLLARARDGELEGTEMYRFAGGSMHPRRPRFERLIDKARLLNEAGDRAWVVAQLLPLYRKGEHRVGAILIQCQVQEVLVDVVRKLTAWDGNAGQASWPPAALLTLVESRDRSALLAAIRLAFAHEDLATTRKMLALVRSRGRYGPVAKGTKAELLAAWQDHWRERSGRLKSAFPKGTVDQMLGTATGW